MKKRANRTETAYIPDHPDSSVLDIENDTANDIENKEELTVKVFVKRARDHFVQYSEKTSLHGVQYIGERKRPILERICWVIIMVVSIYLCMCLIRKAWIKWNTTPVIVSLSETPTAIWEIPFPAITICPEIKATRSVFNYTEILRKQDPTEYEKSVLAAVSLVCNQEKYHTANNLTDLSALDLLDQVSPKFEDIFLKCKYYDEEKDCSALFSKSLTSEGWCYSFNVLHGSEIFKDNVWNSQFFQGNRSLEWSVQEGYVDNKIFEEYPFRAFGVGNKAGLEVLLNAYAYDYDYSCRGPTQGFKLSLHNSYDLPQIDQKYLIIPMAEEFTMTVKPEMSTAAAELKEYEPTQRKCYFAHEKHLQFYKIYNQENCELECITNYTLFICNCVEFYMPHDNNTDICGPENMSCVKDAAVWSRLGSVALELASKHSRLQELHSYSCICLPACTSLSYNIETSQADFNWQEFPKIIPERVTNTSGVRVSRLNIFYKDFYFTPSRRSELYGRTDFLATCGGLLGLFMGFSFISLIEIFHFLTIRVCGNIVLRNGQFWKFFRLRKSQATVI